MPDVQLIDTHCHLDDAQFDQDRAQVLRQAQTAGIVALINPGSSLEDSQRAVDLARQIEMVFAAVGLHPHYLPKDGPDLSQALETLDKLAADQKVVAIGECGFDFKHGREGFDQQRQALSLQLALAKKHNLPVILHCREAYSELAAVVKDYSGLRGVVHSFAGGSDELELMLDLGINIGLGGIVTFGKGTEKLRAAVKQIPSDRLLIETDAPYLSPVPRRGRRNTPAQVVTNAHFIADLRDVAYADLADVTTRNARQLFALDKVNKHEQTA